PFEEKPQILFQTWEIFFAIQCSQPEDSNELVQKLLKYLKELAEYDQSTSTNRPIFLNDNEDHPRESLENSSEENVVSKTNQEPPQDLDVHQLIDACFEEVPKEQKQNMEKTMLDCALDSKLLSINSINSQCLDKKEQEVKNVESSRLNVEISDNSLLDNFLPEFETFCDNSEEMRSGNTTHANYSLLEYELFYFKIEPDQEKLINFVKNDNSDTSNDPLLEEVDLFLFDNSIPPGIENVADDPEGDICFLEELLINDSILSHESFDSNFKDNPSISRPPPEPPDDNFDLEPEAISVVMEDIDEPDEHFNPG
nr:hypothetical protein [Tanacetum cinerariifolium]